MFDELKKQFDALSPREQEYFAEEFSEFMETRGFPPQWAIQRSSLLIRLNRYELAYGVLVSRSDYERSRTKNDGYVKLAYKLSEPDYYDEES